MSLSRETEVMLSRIEEISDEAINVSSPAQAYSLAAELAAYRVTIGRNYALAKDKFAQAKRDWLDRYDDKGKRISATEAEARADFSTKCEIDKWRMELDSIDTIINNLKAFWRNEKEDLNNGGLMT